MLYRSFSSTLLAWVVSSGLSCAYGSIYDSTPSFCNAYATKATSQNQTAQVAKCNVTGLRWSDDEKGQAAWCEKVRPAVAKAETQARAETLLRCLKGDRLKATDLELTPDALGGEMIDAVRKGNLSRVKQLLAAGTDLDYEGMQGNDGKILFVAIGSEKLPIVKFFVDLGLDPNGTFNGGYSPIAMVVRNHVLLDYLLSKGGDANNTGELYDFQWLPLVAAIKAKDLKAVQILIKHKARVQVDEMMGECSSDTLLDYAVKQGTPAIVAVLRQAGAKKHTECD